MVELYGEMLVLEHRCSADYVMVFLMSRKILVKNGRNSVQKFFYNMQHGRIVSMKLNL